MFNRISAFFKKLKVFKDGHLENSDFLRLLYFVLFAALLAAVLLIMTMIFSQDPKVFFSAKWLGRYLLTFSFVLIFQCGIYAFCHNSLVSFIITSIIFYLFEFVNQTMCFITGDPLLPTDLALAGDLGNIVGFVEIPFNIAEIVGLILIVLLIVFYYYLRKKTKSKKLKLWIRITVSVLFIGMVSSSFYLFSFNDSFRDNVLKNFGVERSAFYPTGDFYKNGSVLTFFPRIGDMFVKAPTNYTENKVKDIIEKYSYTPEFEGGEIKPNVIIIQNEAWWDPTLLVDAEFSNDPMELYHEYEKDTIHVHTGVVETPSFGGGTCLPEFEIITGLNTLNLPVNTYPYIQSIKSETPSFVQEYKKNGYNTVAIHPYKGNFYARDTAFPLLGFEKFYDDSNMHYTTTKGIYISDESTSLEIIKRFEEKTAQRAYIFAVTMQNHGGYEFLRYDNYDIDVSCDAMSENDIICLKDYTQGVLDAVNSFKILTDYFEKIEEPTIIVMYGDHLPLLLNGSTYINGGMVPEENLDNYTSGRDFHQTPYIVWANYDISDANIPKRLSPAALGLEIYKMSSPENVPAYYNLFDTIYKDIPIYHFKGLILADGTVFGDEHEEKYVPLIKEYKLMQYDLLNGKKYAYKG